MGKYINPNYCVGCPNLIVRVITSGKFKIIPPTCIKPGKCNRMPIDKYYKRKKRAKFMKVGDKVNYHDIIGGPITSSGHEIKQIDTTPNNFGGNVAWITGKSGCVSIEALSKEEES